MAILNTIINKVRNIQSTKIAVICAMEEELQSILKSLNINAKSKKNNHFIIYEANYKNKHLILILSGIGKVNSAIATQYLINIYSPDIIINIGVAGNLSDDLTFGDVVIANDLIQYDVDATAFDYPLGQIPRMNIFSFESDKLLLKLASKNYNHNYKKSIGRIVSGDRFIHDPLQAEFLKKHFNALACDMEGAAIAHTAYLNKIPFIVIRALSDNAGLNNNSAKHSFLELKEMAASRAADIAKELFQENLKKII